MDKLESTEYEAWRAKVAELGERRYKERLKRRVEELEAKVKELDALLVEQQERRQMHRSLAKVYRNCKGERAYRAVCRQNDFEGCVFAEGIARRCLSPSGPSSSEQQFYHEVHAIRVDDHSVRFCRTCRGVVLQSTDLPCPRYGTHLGHKTYI
jgi:hypothetical protein